MAGVFQKVSVRRSSSTGAPPGASLRQLTPLHDAPEHRAALHRLESAVHLVAVAVLLAPEVHPVHQPVRHPQRPVVHVIVLLARHVVLQRPGARHRHAVRPGHRMQVRAHRMRREVVAAPGNSVDVYLQVLAPVSNPHSGSGVRILRCPSRHGGLRRAAGIRDGRVRRQLRRRASGNLRLLDAAGGKVGQHAPLPTVTLLHRYGLRPRDNAQRGATQMRCGCPCIRAGAAAVRLPGHRRVLRRARGTVRA